VVNKVYKHNIPACLRETSIELRESSLVTRIIMRESSCEFARIVLWANHLFPTVRMIKETSRVLHSCWDASVWSDA